MLLHANEVVSSDRLIEELWGEQPPARAAKSLQVQVSRLRKALGGGEGPIITGPHGYSIQVAPGELDLERFVQLAEEGRLALGADNPELGAELLREALSLWRGPPLADLAYEPFAQREIARLEDLRVAALEQLIEAKLELGRHDEVVTQVETLIVEHPYRERLRAQLMLALYRSDRQADALQAYQDARRALVEELGIEPSIHLRELEQAILAQDPSLLVPVSEAPALTGRLHADAGAVRSQPPGFERGLPAPPTRTFGRDEDRDAVATLLRRDEVRLVTLTGPGGVGKTRLALEVARALEPDLRDGAWFVSLAATARVEDVPSTIAQALEISPVRGEDAASALERFFAFQRALLVLDNYEHVLPAASLVSRLLDACQALKVVATSREALRLRAEHRYAVQSLPVPANSGLGAVERSPAAALFVDVLAPTTRPSSSMRATRARSPSSAAGSTDFPSLSSWPLPERRCSRRRS